MTCAAQAFREIPVFLRFFMLSFVICTVDTDSGFTTRIDGFTALKTPLSCTLSTGESCEV
ncbi:Olfactory Receptor 9Q2 [Manis pentadactyla]|nr:Olfactory Receptor 9Q2 [Manis pentadactyla]